MCCNGLAPLIERRRAQTCSIFVLLNIQGRVNLFLDVNGAEMRSDLCRRFKLLLMQEPSVLRFGERMSIRKRQSLVCTCISAVRISQSRRFRLSSGRWRIFGMDRDENGIFPRNQLLMR